MPRENATFTLPDVTKVERWRLEQIVAELQTAMYQSYDGISTFVDTDKPVNGADLVDTVSDLLQTFGLNPR